MFQAKIVLPKGASNGTGAAIRQACMTMIPSWRPIAFGFKADSNTISSEKTFSDTTDIYLKLVKCPVINTTDITGTIKVLEFNVSGKFTYSDFNTMNSSFQLMYEEGENEEIFEVVGVATLKFYVAMYLGCGNRSDIDNKELLQREHPEFYKFLSVYSSRHTPVDTCTAIVSDRDEDPYGLTDYLTFNVSSPIADENQLLLQAIDTVRRNLDLIESSLNPSEIDV